MRNTFINTLCDLASFHTDVFLLCGDLGYSVLEPFADRFPERYLNMGIAEQNMTQVAVGLSREGYNVFTYSIGNFPTLRCMEQIRYDVCYHQANVKVVAVGSGYAYGPQGASHHTTEDLSMLRSLPNMTLCAPSDPIEAKLAAEYMVSHKGPGYIRINKSGEAKIHQPGALTNLVPGHFLQVHPGTDRVVITTGAILSLVLSQIKEQSLNWAVYSSPFIGGYLNKTLLELANQFDNWITVEEQQLNGGFGSSIVEALSDLYAKGSLQSMPKVKRVGIPNTFISYAGDQDYLRQTSGISLLNE